MNRDELRRIIRALIEQELASPRREPDSIPTARAHQPDQIVARSDARAEFVTIDSDADLARLVTRVLRLSADPTARSELHSGRLVFRLGSSPRRPPMTPRLNRHEPADNGVATRFERALLTERECDQLDPSTTTLELGTSVRITPLAADALRRRGITIRRSKA